MRLGICAVVGVFLVVAISISAMAQSSPDQALAQDWMAMTVALRHVQEGVEALAKENAELRKQVAYWKAWCADRPGCETPGK